MPSHTRWTPEHDQTLQEHYQSRGAQWVANQVGHTVGATRARANILGLIRMPQKRWTAEETNYVRANYGKQPYQTMSETLNRPWGTIRAKALRLGLQRHRRPDAWADTEKQFLRENYHNHSIGWLCKQLHRSSAAITHMICRLGITRRRQAERWTMSEKTFLRNHYPTGAAYELCELLGKSDASIRHMAMRLGLKKEPRPSAQRQAPKSRDQDKQTRWLDGWKNAVKERDDYTCQVCGLREPEIIVAHHILSLSKGGDLLDIANGISLCPNCHARHHHENGRGSSHRLDDVSRESILAMLKSGYSIAWVAEKHGVNRKTVSVLKAQLSLSMSNAPELIL